MLPRIIELSGSPYEMGRRHGRLLRDEVHALAAERLRLSLHWASVAGRPATEARALALAARFLPWQEAYAPSVHAEFMGIAEGAGIEPARLLIGNGYTDYKDVLQTASGDEECSSFIVRDESGDMPCGQTWDMHASAEPFVAVFHRRPDDGPRTLSLTTAGCLSLIGVNERGVAIGNNNLVPSDPRPGVIYLAMIHQALSASTAQEAADAIRRARRASGHNYYLADAAGHAVNLETTAEHDAALTPEAPVYVHTNHYTAKELAQHAAPLAPDSTSPAREARLRSRLEAAGPAFTPEVIHRCLDDHDDGGPCVCVHETPAVAAKSCGVAVMRPAARELWVKAGPPCGGPLACLSFEDA